MRRRLIQSKTGQYSWLQVLALIASGVAYMLGSMTTAVVMLVVATALGVVVTVMRIRQAKEYNRQVRRTRRR